MELFVLASYFSSSLLYFLFWSILGQILLSLLKEKVKRHRQKYSRFDRCYSRRYILFPIRINTSYINIPSCRIIQHLKFYSVKIVSLLININTEMPLTDVPWELKWSFPWRITAIKDVSVNYFFFFQENKKIYAMLKHSNSQLLKKG